MLHKDFACALYHIVKKSKNKFLLAKYTQVAFLFFVNTSKQNEDNTGIPCTVQCTQAGSKAKDFPQVHLDQTLFSSK